VNIAALRGSLAGYANRRFESSAGPAEALVWTSAPMISDTSDLRRHVEPAIRGGIGRPEDQLPGLKMATPAAQYMAVPNVPAKDCAPEVGSTL
jgi:hypothetical protein